MAQHDYSIANATGSAFRTDLNNALTAVVSLNSGAAAPTTMFAFMLWADTTTGLLKIRNSANTNWITIGTLASTNLGLLALSGGSLTGALELDAFEDLGSSGTTDLSTTTSNFVRITGTAAIASFGSGAAGLWRVLRFQSTGATLTYDGTAMILPGVASITASADDRALAISLGSGNWIVLFYQRASGGAIATQLAPTVVATNLHSLTNADNGARIMYTAQASVAVSHLNSLNNGWYVDLICATPASSITQITFTASGLLSHIPITSGGYSTFLLQGRPNNNMTRLMKINSFFDFFPRRWTSDTFPSSAAGAFSTSTGLATRPRKVQCILQCNSGDAGYVAGEFVASVEHAEQTNASASWGLSVASSGAALDLKVGANGFQVNNKGTGASVAITEGRWQFFLNCEG